MSIWLTTYKELMLAQGKVTQSNGKAMSWVTVKGQVRERLPKVWARGRKEGQQE